MISRKLMLPLLTMVVMTVAVTFTAGTAFAQASPAPVTGSSAQTAADPCSTLTSTTSGASSSSTAGYPDEGFDYTPPAPAPDPKPENPVTKSCEGGKIQIMVGNEQEFGKRIGNIIDVRVLILADDSVTIDFGTLQRGILNFDGSDRFKLAKDNPVTISKQQKDGKTLWTVDLRLQTYVPQPGVTFNLDLRYSNSFVPGTLKPEWKVLTTPDFLITRSNTVDNGEELKEGNMEPGQISLPWPTKGLLWGGIGLAGLCLMTPGVLWLLRRRPGRKLSANETAWLTFSEVFAEGESLGFHERHYRLMVDALKSYLGMGARTREEINILLQGDARHDTIVSAIQKIDLALYASKTVKSAKDLLSKEQVVELIAQIKKIVPRPE